MPRVRWTPDEEKRLLDLIAAGRSWTLISGTLIRHQSARHSVSFGVPGLRLGASPSVFLSLLSPLVTGLDAARSEHSGWLFRVFAPCPRPQVALGCVSAEGSTMRPLKPFWLWLTAGLTALGALAYFAGSLLAEYLMPLLESWG
jgi:hypothetical protein